MMRVTGLKCRDSFPRTGAHGVWGLVLPTLTLAPKVLRFRVTEDDA